MMMMMLNHGAHFCAPLVHIEEEKRPSLLSATLITDSLESRHRGGDGVLLYSKWITRLRLLLTQMSLYVETRGELCPSRCFA